MLICIPLFHFGQRVFRKISLISFVVLLCVVFMTGILVVEKLAVLTIFGPLGYLFRKLIGLNRESPGAIGPFAKVLQLAVLGGFFTMKPYKIQNRIIWQF